MHAPSPPPSGFIDIAFDNSYANLPDQFYARQNPTPVSNPTLIKLNVALAQELGLDAGALTTPTGVDVFAGNLIPNGSDPIAMAYGGHQFGNWVPQLGDGRAILLGEVLNIKGQRYDIHLKGSGHTPYSRGGDGRAWLGPVLREYVVSEAMAALNIPTTRALAAVMTGESVLREEALPGAVLTRVATGHIRVGTFEYFSARKDVASLRILADHVIDRFYPDARDASNPYLALFHLVLSRQVQLVAKWMGVGFIHGVMNTDNMSIAGETIDYGPCAFMDAYHPQTVFSYIDQMGRYAFSNQPGIAKWNLASFVSTLVPLFDADEAKAIEMAQTALAQFDDEFDQAWRTTFKAKLGLTKHEDGDVKLIKDLLNLMADNQADFTLTFRGLAGLVDLVEPQAHTKTNHVRALFQAPEAFDAWALTWQARLMRETNSKAAIREDMRRANPAYIPRNHHVEQMIAAAVGGDFEPFERLVEILSHPFDDQPQFSSYQAPPQPSEVVHQTFCGT